MRCKVREAFKLDVLVFCVTIGGQPYMFETCLPPLFMSDLGFVRFVTFAVFVESSTKRHMAEAILSAQRKKALGRMRFLAH